MSKMIKAPRGTNDVLPSESYKWRYLENIADQTAISGGYKEVRFPTFEETELFARGVGDTTDIVQKEMYTFIDRGERSMTLRPEGTASSVRLALEHGLLNETLPLKLYYKVNVFRYDKPQAGRYREFNQFGMELYGTSSPYADAELISMAANFLRNLKIDKFILKINSIGCPVCRAEYQKALKEFFKNREDELCDTCKSRLERNPMRILDCKSPICQDIAKDAPVITDFLCEECDSHYTAVKNALTMMNIPFEEDTGLVRGLDYYTKTVFEFIDTVSGLAVSAGGRYDGLIEELGGKPTPAVGFASGIERLLPLMPEYGEEPKSDLYIGSMGEVAASRSLVIADSLRKNGVKVETDIIGRSVKAQMKYADKIGAKYTLVIGDSELESGYADLKKMDDGTTLKISINDDFSALLK